MSILKVNTIQDKGGNTIISSDGSGSISITGDVFTSKLFHIRQESSSGTQGGTATSGSWQTRTLDTIKTNEVGGSLSSNQFTLPSGTYFIFASAPAQDVIANRIKLYNISDSSDVMYGTNSYSDGGNDGMRSFLSGRFTITASKTFEIQHRVNRTNASFGYGIANGYAVEVYTDALIWKVA